MTTEREVQDALERILDQLIEARDESETDEDADPDLDNTIAMAGIAEDLVDDASDLKRVTTFDRAQLLTTDAGLVLEMNDGSQFQISIVRSR